MTETDQDNRPSLNPAKRFACLIGGALLGIFALGMIAGITKAVTERGSLGFKTVLIYVLTALLVVLALWLVRKGLSNWALARSPKMREYQLVTAGTLLFGGAIGALMQIGSVDKTGAGYSGPLSPAVATVLLAALPLFAWLCYRWHKTADEHEQAAYNFGGMLSLYAYFFASFGWWTAWRGGLLPEPDGFAIFWMVLVVWSIGWAWRRYR